MAEKLQNSHICEEGKRLLTSIEQLADISHEPEGKGKAVEALERLSSFQLAAVLIAIDHYMLSAEIIQLSLAMILRQMNGGLGFVLYENMSPTQAFDVARTIKLEAK